MHSRRHPVTFALRLSAINYTVTALRSPMYSCAPIMRRRAVGGSFIVDKFKMPGGPASSATGGA
eukprot:4574192-Amphidinium_carterae.2